MVYQLSPDVFILLHVTCNMYMYMQFCSGVEKCCYESFPNLLAGGIVVIVTAVFVGVLVVFKAIEFGVAGIIVIIEHGK